jgi:2-polyprenyl-3-methyl-5-hydroxy-6-metoxy-1,4-benzoquinol methylase
LAEQPSAPSLLHYDFRRCKACRQDTAHPRYSLHRGVDIYVCRSCGFHYINYLDTPDGLEAAYNVADQAFYFNYIEQVLQSSTSRFTSKVAIVKQFIDVRSGRCLDIGAGGGLFLHLLQRDGAKPYGIEPDRHYAAFAQQKYGLALVPETVESDYWQRNFHGAFDVVTLWDVIEHVNFPLETLASSLALVRPGGLLCLDTPIRDGLLYRLGIASYGLSRGRWPTLLGMQYSKLPFGHKQIFATRELRRWLRGHGCQLLVFRRIHELSFPYHVYLRRFVPDRASRALAPLASLFFSIFGIRNKALVVARKEPTEPLASKIGGTPSGDATGRA